MALRHLLWLLLWDLTLLVHGAWSSCSVTCSTDYSTSLNCSCAEAAQTRSVFLHVSCSDEEAEVNDSCEVGPSQSWCVMNPVMFDDVLSVSASCVARAADGDGAAVSDEEPSSWALCDVVKPEPPSTVRVENADGFYNITWDHGNQVDCLTFTVRVRNSSRLSEEPVYSLSTGSRRLQLDQGRLVAGLSYAVDVRAKMSPGNPYQGPWSEWSSTATIAPSGTAHTPLTPAATASFLFSASCLLVLLLLCLSRKHKMRKIKQIPNPQHFFAPLDLRFGGNFKEWVNPAFRESDFLIGHHPPAVSEHDFLQLTGPEKRSRGETRRSGLFFHQPPAQGGSLPPPEDGGEHLRHISIHTVSLSEEGGWEEEGGASRGPAADQHGGREEQPGGGSEGAERGSNDAPVEEDAASLHMQLLEAERASLDSLTLEDGYPHVDLDTIDSGFGEYNSPGAPAGPEPGLHQNAICHSNYVKQWVVCDAVEEA